MENPHVPPNMSGQEDRSAAEISDYQSLFVASPALQLVITPEFRIVDATDAYLKATMTVRSEIVGRELFEVFPDNPDDPSATGVAHLKTSLERVIATRELDAMAVQKYDVRDPADPDGGFVARYWSPINSPVYGPDGDLKYIVHQVKDVTEFVEFRERYAEESETNHELRGNMKLMEADILRRSEQLQETNAKLRAAGDAKNEFLSRMSHELRSPLTAVIGYSELLIFDADHASEDRESIEAIHRAGNHLLSLINEVLDLAQIESGHMTISLEPVSVAAVIEDAHELMQPFADRRGIAIQLPKLPPRQYVRADQQRLKQVLINLLSNAIKYNRNGGTVAVEVADAPGERLRIAVIDSGRGIDARGLTKLFTPFERLNATASEVEGTGLGLSLSRGLIEEMGGRIDVESEVGVGSTFTVELRATAPAVVIEQDVVKRDELATVEYAGARTILYIEDLVANVRLVSKMLERRPSVTLMPAMFGGLGVDLAREYKPDLILLDLHLPDMNGAEVLAALADDPSTSEIPVVVLSADATNRQADQVRKLGARSYMTKPIRVMELLKTVDEYLASTAS
jgi:signal transduction histidine kinase/ActR/RegA family two-component response regulator